MDIFIHRMDKEQFWQIIDEARQTAGRWQDMYSPLLDTLSKLEPRDIIRWQQIFNEYQSLSHTSMLWAAATVMHKGCSDDSFDYFRAWLTAQGKDVFLQALADPDSLANLESVQAFGREVLRPESTLPAGYAEATRFKDILSVAAVAYESVSESGGNIYSDIGKSPLSIHEQMDISGEVRYADDMDEKWVGLNLPRDETQLKLKAAFPNLYRTFNGGEPEKESPQGKASIMDAIRAGRSAIKAKVVKKKEPSKDELER
ncbi:MAG: DUF4240 domain-containing protein [Oscillospiraceae bacterium]|nr:DUF4240 domain-containing protein [Oscillospiraceae bacterium]